MILARILVAFVLLGFTCVEDARAFGLRKKLAASGIKAKRAKVARPETRESVNRAEADYRLNESAIRHRQFRQMQKAQLQGLQQFQAKQQSQSANR